MTSRRLSIRSAFHSVLQHVGLLSHFSKLRQRVAAFLSGRPRRSFQATKRRGRTRSLALPGYWRFTDEVARLLWRHKRLFGALAVVYAILTGVLVGMVSQATYSETVALVEMAGDEVAAGGLGALGRASMVFLSTISGDLSGQADASRQVYAGLIGLLTWLTTVWLLRALLAGQHPRLRDGLYNAGAPILPTFLVSLALVVQLLPLALVSLGFGAATAAGLLAGGVGAMLFWVAAALVVALSFYWATSTLMALIVVTLPGMYPWRALRTAGDLVKGRRVRLLLRLLWVLLLVMVEWVLIMIPIIMIDSWLKSVAPALSWMPVVPLALLMLSSATVIVTAAYVYLLYRKVVEDDAAPATN